MVDIIPISGGGGPLAGWVIAQAHGLLLIGRRSGRVLGPVFELRAQMQHGPRGIGVQHVALPVWLLGVPSLELPADALAVEVESFSTDQRARLHLACQQAAELAGALRGEEARVMVVPPGVPLPPMPGGRS